MNTPPRSTRKSTTARTVLVLIGLASVAWFTQATWLPHAQAAIAWLQNEKANTPADDAHDHDSKADSTDTLKLTPAAWKNLGLKTGTVETSDFTREVSFPSVIAERPGRSRMLITAPLTGIITKVFPLEREIVQPGAPLFELRLTHEDVVKAQSDFIKALKDMDIANAELARLEKIGKDVIPGKRILEKQYARDRHAANLSAMKQSLLLHDLSENQIRQIEATREAIQTITVEAPPYEQSAEASATDHVFHVRSIGVSPGQSVKHGDSLGELSDHGLLYIEGQAFEDDAAQLIEASRSGRDIKVIPLAADQSEPIYLKVQSIAAEVDPLSRALKFFLLLPNELISSDSTSSFISWKYRPGFRMEVRVPAGAALTDKIVLPADAVAIDGPNAFVFEQNGDNFDRIDVQVLHRDNHVVVLEKDNALLGSTIATSGAWQMHLAMKNAASGGGGNAHGHDHPHPHPH